MNIVVCLKQVPKKDSILRIGADGKWIDERDISYEMSEADAYALEEALRQKEKHGGEVVVISLGPERARSISAALKDEKYDLILTGLQSDDYGFAQVGLILAQHLGLPSATIVMEVHTEEGSVREAIIVG